MYNYEENINQISKQKLLKMIKINIQKDKSIAREFLELCYKKRRNMRKIIKDIQYLMIEKDDCEKTIKYVNILLKRMEARKKSEHKRRNFKNSKSD